VLHKGHLPPGNTQRAKTTPPLEHRTPKEIPVVVQQLQTMLLLFFFIKNNSNSCFYLFY